ncbi:MAG: DUF2520 domain-containing protein [Rikenellaceae bacterium]|jgi:predicted short-subunit dehydrogenase-like oxidoreductase (DUF2520 family)|nr:DUF2520 domain-containing protein [Rikenellaceae bacterium]
MQRTGVTVVGSGRVAGAFCRRLAELGKTGVQLLARNIETGRKIADETGAVLRSVPQALTPSAIYIIAVSDRAIREATDTLISGDGLVVHTSGGCSLDEISPRIARRGALYPLQTFGSAQPIDFKKIPLFIETENAADFPELEGFARRLSGSVSACDSIQRQQMHVAAVFACNFVNHLYAVGQQLMERNGLDPELLRPLIEQTAAQAATGSPAALQTGPAVRGDRFVIERHLETLRDDPQWREIYSLLTDSIINATKNG